MHAEQRETRLGTAELRIKIWRKRLVKPFPTLLVAATLVGATSGRLAADDFSWIRGANYVPSYAATDVVLWQDYDHDTIDRELGYAQSIGPQETLA